MIRDFFHHLKGCKHPTTEKMNWNWLTNSHDDISPWYKNLPLFQQRSIRIIDYLYSKYIRNFLCRAKPLSILTMSRSNIYWWNTYMQSYAQRSIFWVHQWCVSFWKRDTSHVGDISNYLCFSFFTLSYFRGSLLSKQTTDLLNPAIKEAVKRTKLIKNPAKLMCLLETRSHMISHMINLQKGMLDRVINIYY